MNSRRLVALGGGHVLLAGGLAAGLAGGWGFWWQVGVHAALFAPLLLVGLPLVRGRETGRAPRRVLLAVLAAGLVGRALLVGVPPAPQADLHRMIWEGRVPAAGGDPYRHAPDAPELADLAAALPEVRAGVNYWKLPAIYPPAAQLFFRATTWVSVHPAAMKGALVAAEGVLVLALVLLLRRRGLHPGLVVLYVWNPLPLTAIAGEGHGDALGLAFLALGLLAAESLRPAAAACLAALSALSKIVGGVLLPFLLFPARREARRPVRVLLAALGTTAVVTLPWLTPGVLDRGLPARLGELTGSLGHFARHWRFNESGFLVLEAAFGEAARVGVLALAVALLLVLLYRRVEPALGIPLLAGTVFLLSPVAHPWYFLWTLPFMVLHPERRTLLAATLVLSGTLVLATWPSWHLPIGEPWVLPWPVRLAEYLPPVLILIAGGVANRRRRLGTPASAGTRCAERSGLHHADSGDGVRLSVHHREQRHDPRACGPRCRLKPALQAISPFHARWGFSRRRRWATASAAA